MKTTKTRYFVFFFEAKNGNISSTISSCYIARDGKMPNIKTVIQGTKDNTKQEFEWVVLTGFQEMNEEDYNNMWCDD